MDKYRYYKIISVLILYAIGFYLIGDWTLGFAIWTLLTANNIERTL